MSLRNKITSFFSKKKDNSKQQNTSVNEKQVQDKELIYFTLDEVCNMFKISQEDLFAEMSDKDYKPVSIQGKLRIHKSFVDTLISNDVEVIGNKYEDVESKVEQKTETKQEITDENLGDGGQKSGQKSGQKEKELNEFERKLQIPIDRITFTEDEIQDTRIINALINAKVQTLGDLVECTETEVFSFERVGEFALEKIQETLKKYELEFKSSTSDEDNEKNNYEKTKEEIESVREKSTESEEAVVTAIQQDVPPKKQHTDVVYDVNGDVVDCEIVKAKPAYVAGYTSLLFQKRYGYSEYYMRQSYSEDGLVKADHYVINNTVVEVGGDIDKVHRFMRVMVSPIILLEIEPTPHTLLKKNGIETILDLVLLTPSDVMKLNMIGRIYYTNIINSLEKYGLSLNMDVVSIIKGKQDPPNIDVDYVNIVPVGRSEDVIGVRDKDEENKDDVLQRPISKVYFGQLNTGKIHGVLDRNKIETLGDLIKLKESDLSRFPNMGPKLIQDIKETLKAYKLNLIPESQEKLFEEDEQNLADIPIDQIKFSEDIVLLAKIPRILKRAGVNTLGDLMKFTESDILDFHEMGEYTTNEVKKSLKSYGVELKPELKENPEIEDSSAENIKQMDENIENILQTPIGDCELSWRAYSRMKGAEIHTLRDLVSLKKEDLIRFRDVGTKTVEELINLVEKHGLEFGMVEATSNKRKLDELIINCDLPPKVQRILNNHGVHTLRELITWSEKDVAKLRGLGYTSLTKLDDFLKQHGLKLKGSKKVETKKSENISPPKRFKHTSGNKYKSRNGKASNSILNKPIEDFKDEFTSRTYNALVRAGFDTLGDIAKLTKFEVTQINGIGTNGIKEVIDLVHDHQLAFGRVDSMVEN